MRWVRRSARHSSQCPEELGPALFAKVAADMGLLRYMLFLAERA